MLSKCAFSSYLKCTSNMCRKYSGCIQNSFKMHATCSTKGLRNSFRRFFFHFIFLCWFLGRVKCFSNTLSRLCLIDPCVTGAINSDSLTKMWSLLIEIVLYSYRYTIMGEKGGRVIHKSAYRTRCQRSNPFPSVSINFGELPTKRFSWSVADQIGRGSALSLLELWAFCVWMSVLKHDF